MTNSEIADVLDEYHKALMLTAQTIVPAGEADKANYQFRTQAGADLPKLDEVAAALRTNS